VPREDQLTALRSDYSDMKSMFFGEQPSFDSILDRIRTLESEINTAVNA
jgi:hypothetical protein